MARIKTTNLPEATYIQNNDLITISKIDIAGQTYTSKKLKISTLQSGLELSGINGSTFNNGQIVVYDGKKFQGVTSGQLFNQNLQYLGATSGNWNSVYSTVNNVSSNWTIKTTVPTISSSTGTSGTIAIDTDFIYVCTAPNTWKRAALTAW